MKDFDYDFFDFENFSCAAFVHLVFSFEYDIRHYH